MKKIFSKSVCLLLALGLGSTLFACSKKGGDDEIKVPEEIEDVRQNDRVVEEVKDSDTYFIQNGASEYKIVVPEGHRFIKYSEFYAAQEIQYFVNDASGVTLPIVEDTGLTLDNSAKYISIGDTNIYKASDMFGTITDHLLANDGFKIKTYGNTVVMNAHGNNGTMYTAYGFLERVMGLRYYAEDCWTINKDKNVKLKEMNVVDVPDFQQRQINTGAGDDQTYVVRLKQHGFQGNEIGEAAAWTGNDMSMASEYLKPAIYLTKGSKKSWYDGDGGAYSGQVCLSALLANYVGDESSKLVDGVAYVSSESLGIKDMPYDEYKALRTENMEFGTSKFDRGFDETTTKGAWEVFMHNFLYEYYTVDTNSRMFFFGDNDNTTACRCSACGAAYKKVKCSGQHCWLGNAVSDFMREWKESLPDGDPNKDRETYYGFWGYLFTEMPPTNFDINTRTHTPIDESVVLNDDVFVRLAPIHSVNMKLHLDEEYNDNAAVAFNGWRVVSKRFAVWDYGCNFREAIAPYADWGTLKGNLLMYRDIGVTEIFTQLQSRTSGYALRAYRIWIRAQLLWNVDQDVYALTEEFFNAYYQEAGPVLLEYYEWLQSKMQTFDVLGYDHGNIYQDQITSPKFFSYEVTQSMGKFFEDALKAIEPLKATDPERYEVLNTRINCESLFYWYLLMKNYTGYLTKEKVYEICDNFEKYRLIAGLKVKTISTNDALWDGYAEGIKASKN